MIESKDFKKITVMPQVTIYQGILKNCDQIVKMIEEKQPVNSLFKPWEKWYEQGSKKVAIFSREEILVKEEDSEEIKKEKEHLFRMSEVYDFVRKDYLDEYEKEKGLWPKYVKDWDQVRRGQDPIDLNIYKYSIEKMDKNNRPDLSMDYHFDEMPTDADAKIEHFVVTITFYINDNYDGGEIRFFDEANNKAYKYKPKVGDVTVFPSSYPFYHGVSKILGADRYFMRIFIVHKSEGEDWWLKEYKDKGSDFIDEQNAKRKKYIDDCLHNVTLVSPGEEPPNYINGKLVYIENEIEEIK